MEGMENSKMVRRSILPPKSREDGKDKVKDVLHINTTSITSPASSSPAIAALATARVIADIATVPYPEGLIQT
ncbi:hypothetical protein BYT27DRAFT_7249916 [Phlegmacium glaucopus]|nr:hypothetical protein BYT27DRAFT_7249916 [Phlegmacium glaucopus]